MKELDLIEWYDSLSSSYDELYAEEQLRKYKIAFHKLGTLPEKSRNESIKVLDAGCGTCLITKELNNNFKNFYYVGLDLSINQLLKARVCNVASLKSAIELVAGDIESLPLRENVFDIVLCFTVLTCKKGLINNFKKLMKLAKKTGIVIVTIICPHPSKEFEQFKKLCKGKALRISRHELLCIEKKRG